MRGVQEKADVDEADAGRQVSSFTDMIGGPGDARWRLMGNSHPLDGVTIVQDTAPGALLFARRALHHFAQVVWIPQANTIRASC